MNEYQRKRYNAFHRILEQKCKIVHDILQSGLSPYKINKKHGDDMCKEPVSQIEEKQDLLVTGLTLDQANSLSDYLKRSSLSKDLQVSYVSSEIKDVHDLYKNADEHLSRSLDREHRGLVQTMRDYISLYEKKTENQTKLEELIKKMSISGEKPCI